MAEIPELIPEAVTFADALPPLGIILLFGFCLGCIYAVKGFVSALASGLDVLFPSIPFVGNPLVALVHRAEQAITNVLGSFAQNIERHIAMQFHTLALLGKSLLQELEQSALIGWQVAKALEGVTTLGDVHGLMRELRQAIRHALGLAHATATRVVQTEKTIVRSVAQGVYPRLRSLEHDVTKVIPREIKAARHLAREAENTAINAFKLARSLERKLGATAIAAAVATALAAIGLDWLACNQRSSVNGKSGCALWDDIEGLLAIAAIPLEIASLYELIAVAQKVTETITEGAESLLQV